MSNRRRYDDKFRASALLMLEAAGYPDKGAIVRTAKHLGMPEATLRMWAHGRHNPVPVDVYDEKKFDMQGMLRKEIYEGLRAMGGRREEATYRDLATAVAIMIDKLQLLSGAPTENAKTTITIERSGISTLPDHLAPGTSEGNTESAAIQRPFLWTPVGEDAAGHRSVQ